MLPIELSLKIAAAKKAVFKTLQKVSLSTNTMKKRSGALRIPKAWRGMRNWLLKLQWTPISRPISASRKLLA